MITIEVLDEMANSAMFYCLYSNCRGVATYMQKRICVHIWCKKFGKVQMDS